MEENCFLTAFELLHELLDYGHDAQTIRLKEFFSDPSRFPPDQISWYNSIRVADPQSLLEEKEALSEKLAISEYEFRLAQEDITRLKTEGQKRSDCSIDKLKEVDTEEFGDKRPEVQRKKKDFSFTDIGPLKNNERRDLKCAVKEYLLLAGYRLTAMTFYEEVTDQNLDIWQDSPVQRTFLMPCAITISTFHKLQRQQRLYPEFMLSERQEKIAMLQENESLKKEIERLNEEKDGLFRSKEKFEEQISAFNNIQVQSLKQSSEHQRRNLNDCRAEITSLKMHIEGSRAGQYVSATEGEKQISSLPEEVEKPAMEKDGGLISESSIPVEEVEAEASTVSYKALNSNLENQKEVSNYLSSPSNGNFSPRDLESILKVDSGIGRGSNLKSENANGEAAFEETACVSLSRNVGEMRTETDLLPQCWEQACVSLSRNVGEMRTETELLPQCWEQINHTYQERRLLVAQSCGELAEYVRPEIRDSLILSTIQQLIEDSATVVREAAAHNLALLLPLFPNTNKYFKVEEMMFQFICDPSGLVVETTLKELLPAVMKCSPLSRIELRTAVYQKAVETCPFPSTAKSEECVVSVSLLETYAEGRSEWPMFEWMHVDKRLPDCWIYIDMEISETV
ncbi:unnamed protein product [Brassica oleracea]